MRRLKVTFGFCAVVCIFAWVDWRFCLHFLCCALFHELGHLFAMRLCRVSIERISLTAAGAVITTMFFDHRKELLCAAAGPVAGLLLGVLVLRCVPKMAIVSFLLSMVNLLPIYPLDGGRMLQAGLCLRFSETQVSRILHFVTGVVCCILMLLACWGAICMQMGLWPIFAALVLLWRVGSRE